MAPLPLTTTISATSSRASSPMEDDDDNNPYFNAVASLEYSIALVCDDTRATADHVRQFLTNATPEFPQGIPRALGLHIVDGPLHEVLLSQAELIKALTAEVRGLAAIVNERLPPPGVSVPAPPAPAPTPTPKPSAQPPPKLPTTKPSAPPKASTPVQAPKPTPPTPSYASTARKPVRPSLIVSKKLNLEASQPLAVRHSPSNICAHLNAALSTRHPEVSLSAARWTKNNNLVVVAGPDTTAHQLNASSHFISDALSTFLSHSSSEPLPISAKENVQWSRLLINNLPTGVTATRGAYSPEECQDTLARDNPVYRSLRLTRLPSWVKRPDGYAAGSSSSLVVTFEDPTGSALRELLGHGSLFAFGQQGHLKRWKQKPRAKPSTPPTDRPLAPA
ncbi:hypothetical protein EDB84DRAFT_1621272, partial [Lactarius hengduanensis]